MRHRERIARALIELENTVSGSITEHNVNDSLDLDKNILPFDQNSETHLPSHDQSDSLSQEENKVFDNSKNVQLKKKPVSQKKKK